MHPHPHPHLSPFMMKQAGFGHLHYEFFLKAQKDVRYIVVAGPKEFRMWGAREVDHVNALSELVIGLH